MPRRIKDLSNRIKHKISPSHINKSKEASHKTTEPQNLQVIKAKLAQNALVELRLGFDEVEFYSKRDVQSLIHVLEEQFLYRLSLDKHSCLKSISIGWKLPAFAVGPIFQRVIPLLLQEPIRITHIQLALRNTPIPESCLKRIVSWSTLECLDLRSIRVMRLIALSERAPATSTPASSPRASLSSQSSHIHFHSNGNTAEPSPNGHGCVFHLQDSPHSWKSDNIVKIVPYVSLSVKTLKLIDCGLRSHHVAELCEVIRRKMYGLQELSLRLNRDLDGGFGQLFSLPCIKALDLSLCDLGPHDGIPIARAMEKHLQCSTGTTERSKNHHLERLCLAGNYRMSETIPDVVLAAACRLVELDCSFCDVQSKLQRRVFTILATTPNTTLKSFSMQGTRINRVNELLECIRDNTTLRRLILDHPREPFPLTLSAMEGILETMKLNYSLCTLRLDTYNCDGVWRDMEFWFELNRCGRRVLLQSNEQNTSAWSTILAAAAENDNKHVLFWLLKHGSLMFAK